MHIGVDWDEVVGALVLYAVTGVVEHGGVVALCALSQLVDGVVHLPLGAVLEQDNLEAQRLELGSHIRGVVLRVGEPLGGVCRVAYDEGDALALGHCHWLGGLAHYGTLGGGGAVGIGGAHLDDVATLNEGHGLLDAHIRAIVGHRLDATIHLTVDIDMCGGNLAL